MTAALELRDLTSGYAGVPVVRGLHLTVDAGEVVSLLGSNGAGKTTVLLTAAGALEPMAGDVMLCGSSLRDTPTHRRVRAGLGFVPDNRGLFSQLTARENLRLAQPRGHDAISIDEVLAHFPALGRVLARRCGLLSGGEQQMLAVAKAFIRRPEVLLVDELTLGLAPLVAAELFASIRRLADERGVAVLLVEQHVELALRITDRVYVLAHGETTLTGAASELRHRRDLLSDAYLGTRR